MLVELISYVKDLLVNLSFPCEDPLVQQAWSIKTIAKTALS